MQLPSFIFNAQNDTPEAVARRRALAEAMLARGTTGVASNVGEGLAQLGQAISGRIGVNRADGIAAKRKAAAYGMLGPAFAPMAPAAPVADTPLTGSAGSDTLAGGTGGTGIDAPSSRSIVGYSRGSSEPTKPWTDTINATNPGIIDMTGQAGFGYRFGKMPKVNGLVVHHTGGRGDVGGVINTFKQRNFPAQFVMDRDGKIYRTLPDGARGQHMKNGQGIGAGFNNGNTLGIEVIARDNNDWTPAQRQAMAGFSANMGKTYGFDPMKAMFGHGEVNPHKRPDEGMAFVDWFRKTGGKGGPVIVPASGPPPGAPAASEDMSVTQAPLGSQQPMGTAIGTFQQPKVYAPAPGMQPAPDVPAPTPTAVPAPMASAAPMNAYQRMMMQSLGKEAGGLQAPPNRAQMAAVMGQGGQPSGGGILSNIFAGIGGGGQPPAASPFAPQSANLPSANLPSASGRYAADMRQIDNSGNSGAAPAGNRLGQLQSVISSPQFAWLEPAQQKFVMDEYERERAAANPDPMAKVQLETAQVNLEKARKDLASQGIETVVVGDALVNKQTGDVIYQGEPKTGEETATQKDYKFAIDQLRKRGVPENKLPSFQEWAKPKSRGIVFKGADGTEVTIGGSADETGIDGTSLPAEVGGRIGLGQAFLEKDYPEIIKMIEAGDATGPLDFASGYMGRGNSGIVQRRMATGIDALRRGLTGAGMGMSEAAEYAKRYAPQFTDDASTLKRKAEGLKTDLEAVAKGAIFGKAGKVGEMVPKSGAPSPQTPTIPAPATPDAPVQQQSAGPPPDAIQMLKADPSWEAVRDFNEIFGPGAAERILQEDANGRK